MAGNPNALARRQEAESDLMTYDNEQPRAGAGAAIEIAQTRAAQEVQAAIVMAKRFPRDQVVAFNAIIDACKRKSLAEQSQYAYPRGDTTVTGPSIRLAEVMAQNWGNLDFGVVEVEQRNGESTMCAYCWDQQTNVRQTRVFQVKHERHTKRGAYRITDPRDIYEMTANQGARRLRACILGVIPGDVVDAAIEQCDKTLQGDGKTPLIDRVRAWVKYFEDQFGVRAIQIEKRLGHRVDAITEVELVGLRKIATSLKDNMASLESFFPSEQTQADPSKPATQALADRLAGAGKKPEAPASETEGESEKPEASGSSMPENPEDEIKNDLIEKIAQQVESLGNSASQILQQHGFDGSKKPDQCSVDQLQALSDALVEAAKAQQQEEPPADGELLPGSTKKGANPKRHTTR